MALELKFYGRISDQPDTHESETLTAIKENLGGLQSTLSFEQQCMLHDRVAEISGERLWSELRRIAVGRFADSVLDRMMELDTGGFLELPYRNDRSELFTVSQRAKDFKPGAVKMISTLINAEDVIAHSFPRKSSV